ncbi:biotin/lipoyl-binding protein [Bradyrhizobium sp. KBS0727]|uniref:lipoyl domain-containing protein n=1 Tax=unclassified Bradyrhizobium TaxID=2631580 RepID=UPI00110D8E45|nr:MULTISPECIES: lipoyl domain-containing protein [unclassified Bradyrhizobium]QDW40109.1 biotin/lipoyl-binding protein [Bradyrhizobium sp. KBS0725]QDW46712.1 biotin/lipoyl-binding protein [Bradyrhizobium sp. KBS0727]
MKNLRIKIEGMVASWHVAPGDQVRSGDVLFVVETEKIATEIVASGDGRTIEVAEGSTAPVGAIATVDFAHRLQRPR